jgi:hypothetical protein
MTMTDLPRPGRAGVSRGRRAGRGPGQPGDARGRRAAGRRAQVMVADVVPARRALPARARPGWLGAWLATHPEWPVTALLAGYPLWWALGAADFAVMLLAIPMALRMLAWRVHGTRRLRLPPGFGIWLLFLLVMLAGIFMLKLNAPGTVVSSFSRRFFAYGNRAVNDAAVTVVLLYAGNLTETELSRRRLAWLLGLLAIYTTAGGIAGVLAPSFQFTSPLALVIPHALQNSTLVGSALHPGFSQLQSILGGAVGRPKAPFDYTNDWGDALSILLPWLLVAWWVLGSRRQRLIAGVTVAIAAVPVVYSLNRGVWIGLGLGLVYVAVRMAAGGKTGPLALICAGLAVMVLVLLVTPLGSLVAQRLQHGQSDSIRSYLTVASVRDALSSPVLGFGDTRHTQGSPNSIAVGPTPQCPQCGQYPIGSNGQLWLLLICNGFLGAGLYLAFFGYGVWRYRRDTTPFGVAGVMVLLLSFVYMFTYTSPPPIMAFTMLAYALLWKNDQQARELASPAGRQGTAAPRQRRAAAEALT